MDNVTILWLIVKWILTLKKLKKERSSGTLKDGSSGPSITAEVGTASSSSNSLKHMKQFKERMKKNETE